MRAPERLHLLDVLRGLAAMAVIVFHWQFWGTDSHRLAPPGGFAFPRAVAEALLAFFYQCGASAVGLFFTLSGFVFFWLFRDAVHAGRVSGWGFFVDRFSRLYPLHLVTLVLVAIGQHLYAAMNNGLGWNSPVNDAANFVGQLLVFPLWTRSRTIEFNLPVWSLVVEALLYVVFFVVARRTRLGAGWTLLMLAVAGGANWYSDDIGYGMSSFFMGGLAYVAFERGAGAMERPLAMLVGASWLFALVFGCGVINLVSTPLAFIDRWYAVYVLFPSTVLYLAHVEARRGPMGVRWAWIGDATYAMYLLGFPLMLAIAVAVRACGGSFDGLQSPVVMLAFLAVTIVLSLACHRGFERPVQKWLRRRLLAAPQPRSTR